MKMTNYSLVLLIVTCTFFSPYIAFGRPSGTNGCGGGCWSSTENHITTYNDGSQYNNGGGGGGQSGGGNGGGGDPAPVDTVAQKACALTISKDSVKTGAPVTLLWTPAPYNNNTNQPSEVTVIRRHSNGNQTQFQVPAGSTSFTETTTGLSEGRYSYIVSYDNVEVDASNVTCTSRGGSGEHGNACNQYSEPVLSTLKYQCSVSTLVTAPTPPPTILPCDVKAVKKVVPKGTPIALNWTPAPKAGVAITLKRDGTVVQNGASRTTNKVLVVPNGVSTYTDSGITEAGTYNYILSYSSVAPATAPPTLQETTGGSSNDSYQCSVQVTVEDVKAQCNDGIDNEDPEDTLIDQQDPGCHTDGDPTHQWTYNRLGTSETNVPTNLTATVVSAKILFQARNNANVEVIAREQNVSTIFAPTNRLTIGWRKTTDTRTTCTAQNGAQCLVLNGHRYQVADFNDSTYLAGKINTLRTAVAHIPNGTYDICAFADSKQQVIETSETDNSNCVGMTVTGTPPPGPPPPAPPSQPAITGPATISAIPALVRRGGSSVLTWNTGGRGQCTIRGSNNEVIPIARNVTGVHTVTGIQSEVVYTIGCVDPGYPSSAQAKIRVLPQIQEI